MSDPLAQQSASTDREATTLIGAVIGLLLILASSSFAATSITLPLDGYYRPGKFFPVQVTSDQPAAVHIDIDNGVSARGNGTSLTLPVMLLSPTVRSIRVTVDGVPTDLPVRALEANQPLVLTTVPKDVRPLFGLGLVKSLVTVTINSDNLRTLDAAFESADDVLITPEQLVLLPEAATRQLLASGTRITLNAAAPSGSRWPWRSFGPGSIIDLPVRGPTTSSDDLSVYDAVASFTAGRSPTARRTVWLAMAMFSIVALATTLIGCRGIYATAAVSLLAVAGGALFAARQSSIAEQRFNVTIPGQPMAQRDEWRFRMTSAKQDDVIDMAGDMDRPIFGGQADALGLWIDCTSQPRQMHFTLRPGMQIAFVRRQFIPPLDQPGDGWRQGDAGDFNNLLRRFYLKPTDSALHPISANENAPVEFFQPAR